jgi:hypothetical protein
MAFSCTVDRGRRLGIARVSGGVDTEELLQIIRALLEDPDWEPGFNILWDGCRITDLVVDEREMQTVASDALSRSDRLGEGKTAIVVTRDRSRELAHMFTALARHPGRDRRVFTSAREALEWLAVPGHEEK